MATRGIMNASGTIATRANRIRSKLQTKLEASIIEIEDVSHQHSSHAAMKDSSFNGGETHLNLKIVSSKFEGLNLVKRHRLVYDLLSDELNSGLHALSINAKTPLEVSPN